MGWDAWWLWVSIGIGLAILEVAVPGFIFLGFALGAIVVGLLLLLGGGLAAWLTGSASMLLLVFALLSVLAWLMLRKLVGVRQGQSRVVEKDINDD
ncbi:MAG: NfeD family protein [Tropicimonas sp.]|uniref:NfeD family protein n=1 Tax=Tropicimonas sp. TaxID=2067044 RepID=UPI003A874EA1